MMASSDLKSVQKVKVTLHSVNQLCHVLTRGIHDKGWSICSQAPTFHRFLTGLNLLYSISSQNHSIGILRFIYLKNSMEWRTSGITTPKITRRPHLILFCYFFLISLAARYTFRFTHISRPVMSDLFS